MSEYSPIGWIPKMTKNQVKKYIREMEEKRLKAQKELKEAQENWELKKQEDELNDIENKIDNLQITKIVYYIKHITIFVIFYLCC